MQPGEQLIKLDHPNMWWLCTGCWAPPVGRVHLLHEQPHVCGEVSSRLQLDRLNMWLCAALFLLGVYTCSMSSLTYAAR
jgi:hypothetical protein